MNNHTIYLRTPRGTTVLRSPDSTLTRASRMLLMAIDGRSSVRAYRTLLTQLGDVVTLLQSLEAQGLIADTGVSHERNDPAATASQTSAPFAVDLRSTDVAKATVTVTAARAPTDSPQPAHAPLGSPAPVHFKAAPLWNAPSSSASQARLSRLADAKAMMIDFLSQYLPEVALETALSIDALDSVGALEANLPDYAALVARVEPEGAKHLRALNALLNHPTPTPNPA